MAWYRFGFFANSDSQSKGFGLFCQWQHRFQLTSGKIFMIQASCGREITIVHWFHWKSYKQHQTAWYSTGQLNLKIVGCSRSTKSDTHSPSRNKDTESRTKQEHWSSCWNPRNTKLVSYYNTERHKTALQWDEWFTCRSCCPSGCWIRAGNPLYNRGTRIRTALGATHSYPLTSRTRHGFDQLLKKAPLLCMIPVLQMFSQVLWLSLLLFTLWYESGSAEIQIVVSHDVIPVWCTFCLKAGVIHPNIIFQLHRIQCWRLFCQVFGEKRSSLWFSPQGQVVLVIATKVPKCGCG